MSPSEAMWKLFYNEITYTSHSIIRLPVHLPNEQNICFNLNEISSIVSKTFDTKLTAWFKLNQINQNANRLNYLEIPLNYVFHEKTKTWNQRKARFDKTIARMYFVGPVQTERFSLRLLLLHTKGAKSFDDLKTVSGIQYANFTLAAKALGFLSDDKQWYNTMDEAIDYQMPFVLRQLFAFMCLYCEPVNPLDMCNKYKDDLSEDYIHNPDFNL